MRLSEYLIDEDNSMAKVPVKKDIKIRKCTVEDWKDFNTPSRKRAPYLEAIKERDNMYCISPADMQEFDLVVFGEDEVSDLRRIELEIVACRPEPGKECNDS